MPTSAEWAMAIAVGAITNAAVNNNAASRYNGYNRYSGGNSGSDSHLWSSSTGRGNSSGGCGYVSVNTSQYLVWAE